MPTFEDPYRKASFIHKLQETGTVFLTDLDGTHATALGSLRELEDRAAVRKFLDEKNFVSGAVTARTPALVMSSSVYRSSRELGHPELEPHCGLDMHGNRVYVPPEELPFFAYSQDWDMIASLGYGVYPRNGHGYLMDREFDNLLNYDYVARQPARRGYEPLPWRQAALAFIAGVWPHARDYFAAIEFSHNYREGKTDVMPLPYRIQLEFKGSEGLERMRELRAIIRRQKFENDPVALRMAVIDESKPNTDPDKSKYTLYLVPWAARKERMINHFVSKATAAANRGLKNLFYAGDTPTDLRAGLYARGDGPLTFLLATGSLLAPYLIEQQRHYGEEPLDFIWESLKRPTSRLSKTAKKGVYTFKVQTRPWTNLIVIGDERYPGTTAPGSVLAFLEEFATDDAGH